MNKKPFHLAGVLATILLMWGSIAWMIESRAAILRDGQDIVLKTRPVDPRDFLRGRYVRLNYDISRIDVDGKKLFGDASLYEIPLKPIYISLELGPDGRHIATGASWEKPSEGMFLKGKIRNRTASTRGEIGDAIVVEFGIERFYASETVAPDLEKRMRNEEITDIVVAVNSSGKPQIKALKQGERTFLTEELY